MKAERYEGMSVNTSEEYLDELLEAIEPIIRIGEPEITETPIEEPVSVVEEEISNVDEVEIGADESVDVTETALDVAAEDSSAIGDLLASLAGDEADIIDEGMSQEDVETMLFEAGNQVVEEENAQSHDEDVKELLKQFTEDDDLSDIQDILDKNDNGEALDNSMLDIPDVEVFQLDENEDDTEEESDNSKKNNPIGKLVGGISGLFKKRKNKKRKDIDESTTVADSEFTEKNVQEESNLEITDDADVLSLLAEDSELVDMDGINLEDLLSEDMDELVFDEDMSDIDQLLTGGTLIEEDGQEGAEETGVSLSGKKGSKRKVKKESFFSRIVNALTEEMDESDGKKVSEAGKTGVTQENLSILEELSEEDKKKAKKAKKEAAKEEKKNKKSGKKGKNSSKTGEDDNLDNDKKSDKKKAKKAKKAIKKLETKEKPRKVEVITKPEKKLPKKRVLSVLVLCFSVLAGILILQNVVFKSDNWEEAKHAYDNGDYATCYANLESVERNGEEETLYQKTRIIMSVQRKWDSYKNFVIMGEEVEALNSLLEGVAAYRNQEEAALEWGVHAQITLIYQGMMEALQGYGLSVGEVDEILGYESKVTYTKRLDSIINGTPFVVEEATEESVTSEAQPLQDVLPGEDDFLPDDAIIPNEPVIMEETNEGEAVVVGSNPVNVSSQDERVTFEEPVSVGGQNVGSGSTNLASEVTGQSVIVGVR